MGGSGPETLSRHLARQSGVGTGEEDPTGDFHGASHSHKAPLLEARAPRLWVPLCQPLWLSLQQGALLVPGSQRLRAGQRRPTEGLGDGNGGDKRQSPDLGGKALGQPLCLDGGLPGCQRQVAFVKVVLVPFGFCAESKASALLRK